MYETRRPKLTYKSKLSYIDNIYQTFIKRVYFNNNYSEQIRKMKIKNENNIQDTRIESNSFTTEVIGLNSKWDK